MELLAQLDMDEVRRHVGALTALAADRLGRAASASSRSRRTAGPHIALRDRDPERLAGWLASRGISVSPRRPLVRMSFHSYHDERDVDAVCTAVERFRPRRGSTRHAVRG